MKKKPSKKSKSAAKLTPTGRKSRRWAEATVNVKLSVAALKALKLIAKKCAGGNVSALLRHAGLKYTPKKGETIPLKA